MFVLHLASVLASLLSLSAAAPTQDDCSHLIRPLTANELPQILGRWILIGGFSNNDIFDSVLENLESMWMSLNTTADNSTLLLDTANPLPTRHNHNAAHLNPPPHRQTSADRKGRFENGETTSDMPRREGIRHGPLIKGRCLRVAHNVTFVDDQTLEVRLEVASTNYKFLQTCHDCLLMHAYTKENSYQALYLFGRNKTLAATDLETFSQQAACLQFPQPAKFHYDPNKELCPV
uniref:uncharacterized protein LOC124068172 isoform X1 n=1 Tax=Scatophagus argus TaxID=75038 RepID=UPI001ED7F948|nr:uncharacterized protein LOC124068172 isoform X1 [Scatophagus argus]